MFHRLLLHPDLKLRAVEDFLNPIVDLAKRAPKVKQVVLFDELNTSSILGILKDIMVDHTLNGEHLPDNVFFVGCINPYRPSEQADAAGCQTECHLSHREEYFVHKLPMSMMALRWTYPPLAHQELQEFVQLKMKLQFKGESFLDDALEARFASLICKCQELFMSNVGQSSVSQRDIHRCLVVLDYFQKHWPGHERANVKVMRCILLAVAVVYHFRLSDVGIYGSGDDGVTGPFCCNGQGSCLRALRVLLLGCKLLARERQVWKYGMAGFARCFASWMVELRYRWVCSSRARCGREGQYQV